MVRNLSLTQYDFDILMRNAILMQEYDKKAANEMLAVLRNIQGPALEGDLTEDKAKILLGNSYSNIVLYNFDTKTWNRDSYRGHTISDASVVQKLHTRAKAVLEKESWFKDWELAGAVTMTIDSRFFCGPGQIIKNPTFAKRGGANVGTVIVRNRETGVLTTSAAEYQCLYNHIFPDDAAANSFSDLAGLIVRNSLCRAGLKAILQPVINRQK